MVKVRKRLNVYDRSVQWQPLAANAGLAVAVSVGVYLALSKRKKASKH